MRSLRFSHTAEAGLQAIALPLRISRASGIVDPEPFRAQARGDAPVIQGRLAQAGGIRALHVPEGRASRPFDLPGPWLNFVVSGAVEIETANEGCVCLRPGDLFLMDADGAHVGGVRAIGDCRLIQILVGANWPDEKARIVASTADRRPADVRVNLKRMYKGADDRSRFRSFSTLFAGEGAPAIVRPATGLRFLAMAADTFITWHPEVVNNLVLVLSGGLELEVGGDGGATEVFWPGDVCLAEDRTGEGHIDRMQGEVLVAIVVMEDVDLWPTD